MTDGNEYAVDLDVAGSRRRRNTAQTRADDPGVIAENLIDGVIPDHAGLACRFQRKQAILQYLLGAQLVAAMHQGDVRGDIGEIQGFLHGRVAAADDCHGFAAIEEAVAGGASRNAPAAEGLFGRNPQVLGRSARRDDQRIAGVLAVVAEQAEGALTQFHPIDVIEHNVGIEALGVTAHAVHECGPLEVLDIPGPIVDIRGRHELATLLQTGDE